MSSPVIIDGQQRQGRARPLEILDKMGPDLYRRAYQDGMSFSAWLEFQDPSTEYTDRMDAFHRLLHAARIRPRAHAAIGLPASDFDAFLRSEQTRALIPEQFRRWWREVQTGQSANTRAIYTSTDDIPGSTLRPTAYASAMRTIDLIVPPFSLAEIVALTTPIRGSTYQSSYLVADSANLRQARVGEAADIPLYKLLSSDHVINLLKYGGGLLISYEGIRRSPIDKVQFWIQQMALQAEKDKVSQAINVLVSGDGNTATAADAWRAKTDFDSTATGKTITNKVWWSFKLKFAVDGFMLTHIIGSEGDITKLGLLNVGDSNQQVYLADPTNPGTSGTLRDGVVYGISADVPTDTLVGLDARRALERVSEIGSNIEEIERFARNQTQVVTMTENEAFGVLQPGATKTLLLET